MVSQKFIKIMSDAALSGHVGRYEIPKTFFPSGSNLRFSKDKTVLFSNFEYETADALVYSIRFD